MSEEEEEARRRGKIRTHKERWGRRPWEVIQVALNDQVAEVLPQEIRGEAYECGLDGLGSGDHAAVEGFCAR